MDRFKKDKFLFFSMITVLVLFVEMLVFLWWLLWIRDGYTGALPVTMYSIMGITYITLAVFSILARVTNLDNKVIKKYIFLAFITSPIFIGQWIYVYLYRYVGIRDSKMKEAVIRYYASEMSKMDETNIKGLTKEQIKEINTISKFKDNEVLKNYEADYYIAKILVSANVLDYSKIKKTKLKIIASNII